MKANEAFESDDMSKNLPGLQSCVANQSLMSNTEVTTSALAVAEDEASRASLSDFRLSSSLDI